MFPVSSDLSWSPPRGESSSYAVGPSRMLKMLAMNEAMPMGAEQGNDQRASIREEDLQVLEGQEVAKALSVSYRPAGQMKEDFFSEVSLDSTDMIWLALLVKAKSAGASPALRSSISRVSLVPSSTCERTPLGRWRAHLETLRARGLGPCSAPARASAGLRMVSSATISP